MDPKWHEDFLRSRFRLNIDDIDPRVLLGLTRTILSNHRSAIERIKGFKTLGELVSGEASYLDGADPRTHGIVIVDVNDARRLLVDRAGRLIDWRANAAFGRATRHQLQVMSDQDLLLLFGQARRLYGSIIQGLRTVITTSERERQIEARQRENAIAELNTALRLIDFGDS